MKAPDGQSSGVLMNGKKQGPPGAAFLVAPTSRGHLSLIALLVKMEKEAS